MREPRDATKTDVKTTKPTASTTSFPLILDVDDFKGDFSFDALFGNLVNNLLSSFKLEDLEAEGADSQPNVNKFSQATNPLFPEVEKLLSLFKDSSKELIELRKQIDGRLHNLVGKRKSALLVCDHNKEETKRLPTPGTSFTSPLPPSQLLGKVKDFLGVMSEANKRLEHDAKDHPEKYDIEGLTGKESKVIEMDLMLGVADLHTPEAVDAAESAIFGWQPVISLPADGSESDS
ncbi:unnamed protein product [Trifolium pratense]|uniref:Uncharacterized protein n=1 Tax=Trifolium pratense TaxID=57577 RepID=A0ACB0JLS0_TRIPR|nr:unnamed protein product [Trifolium pratense]